MEWGTVCVACNIQIFHLGAAIDFSHFLANREGKKKNDLLIYIVQEKEKKKEIQMGKG